MKFHQLLSMKNTRVDHPNFFTVKTIARITTYKAQHSAHAVLYFMDIPNFKESAPIFLN